MAVHDIGQFDLNNSNGAPLRVRLLNYFERPTDISVAAAMSCYSSKLIAPQDLKKERSELERRAKIAERTFRAGHNTTRQHAHFQFALEGVSRFFIWSFLHDHPFYNSDQVSQRYVHAKPENIFIPALSPNGRKKFLMLAERAFDAYEYLTKLLFQSAENAYYGRFPSRKKRGNFEKEILKKAQEVSRYLLPICSTAHLHHTISALTLHRYRKMAETSECMEEAERVIRAMCEEVERIEPDFFRCDTEPFTAESSIETSSVSGKDSEWVRSFDEKLNGRISLLEGIYGGEDILCEAVRNALGATKEELSDEIALSFALDPQFNPLLADSLNPTYHSNLSRALSFIRLTFVKKLSISADSQNQRHRMILRVRPPLAKTFNSDKPDFVIPQLIAESKAAEDYYETYMNELWDGMRELLNDGEALLAVLYLLPNAFPIRLRESGDLLSFRHKWAMRLCLNAQEEIWQAAKEEVLAVRKELPKIGKYISPPCSLRLLRGLTPACPEGKGYCGVPVWKKNLFELNRVI